MENTYPKSNLSELVSTHLNYRGWFLGHIVRNYREMLTVFIVAMGRAGVRLA